jgi:integrase
MDPRSENDLEDHPKPTFFLRSALDEAVTDGILQINPVSLVTASRYQSDKSEAESSYVVDPLSPAK